MRVCYEGQCCRLSVSFFFFILTPFWGDVEWCGFFSLLLCRSVDLTSFSVGGSLAIFSLTLDGVPSSTLVFVTTFTSPTADLFVYSVTYTLYPLMS